MTATRLAVDYGTSNTVAMLDFGDGRIRPLLFDGSPLLPSAVYAQADGDVLTGRDALRSARLEPACFEPNPKRRIDDVEVLLGERSWPVLELVARTLGRVAAEATRTAGPVSSLVMTCPVEWGPVRRRVLAEAAERAGLPRPELLAEPVAAAAYFAAKLDREVTGGRSVVVYDLGGGTFDVCVVRRDGTGFSPLAYRGVDDFGGVDLDALVVEQIAGAIRPASPETWSRLAAPGNAADRRHFRALWDDARDAKEALSRQSSAQVFVPLADRDAQVSREAFESSASEALGRTVEVTLATVREAQVRPSDVAGLFLVGGSTRVPMVATLLHRRLGMAPTLLEQPETVVAEGALVATATATVTASAAVEAAPRSRPAPLPLAPHYAQPIPRQAAVTEQDPPVEAPRVAGPEGPPREERKLSRWMVPSIGMALALMGGTLLMGTPWAPGAGQVPLMIAGCAVGSTFFLAGGIMTWFTPRLPSGARFWVPAGYLLFAALWLAAPLLESRLPAGALRVSAAILAGTGAVLALVTAATLKAGREARR
ncbi:Hsp70 family protein [Phytomonospora endophytica]|uniref:Hsp70 family protein n=1 Tax=Phytomonospora endophytica TaxID=714109 RepID=A0A841FMU7_9ACTN|nr:Hsp70 family protein [Phytomonospora endophytica]MBB6034537.1 hypothetical protein [Phytomonospora endophytica]GIG70445.1 hypothetical protein Pen01_67400 [Phytomonospora endophytica]